jgi:hypothetical protein
MDLEEGRGMRLEVQQTKFLRPLAGFSRTILEMTLYEVNLGKPAL